MLKVIRYVNVLKVKWDLIYRIAQIAVLILALKFKLVDIQIVSTA